MLTWWTPLTTRLLIAFTTAFFIVLDFLLAIFVSNEATESKQMQWIGQNWPIVIVAYGGLGAHFFVAKYDVWPGYWVFLKPMLCLLTGFVAFLVAWQQMAPEAAP
jgi:hypothetical protein